MFTHILLSKKIFLSAIVISYAVFFIFSTVSATLPEQEYLEQLIRATQKNPIKKPEHMYSTTTPMQLVRNQEGNATTVLKQQYDADLLMVTISDDQMEDLGVKMFYKNTEENRNQYQYAYKVRKSWRVSGQSQKTAEAFSLTKRADVGSTFAKTYYISTGVPLTFEGENGEPTSRPFYGLAQPVVTLFSDENKTADTPLTSILRKVDSPHGALSYLALEDAYQTEKWVPMEEGKIPDLARPYGYTSRMKRITVDSKITPEEYAFAMASISRAAIEDDFLSFMLTQSGDSVARNWMFSLNSDATLLDISLIDFENIFSNLGATAPMALGTLQGFYPLSETNREKVLSWDVSSLATIPHEEEVQKRLSQTIPELQICLRQEPTLSLQNLYFRVFGKFEAGAGMYAQYGWIKTGVADELVKLFKSRIFPQDPSYRGLEPQTPFFEEIDKAFLTCRMSRMDWLEEEITGVNHYRYTQNPSGISTAGK